MQSSQEDQGRWAEVSSQDACMQSSIPERQMRLPDNLEALADSIPRRCLGHIPLASAGRYANAWAECLEGCLAGSHTWGELAKYRA
eukprot:746194-Karenia_brevis.AAC.1